MKVLTEGIENFLKDESNYESKGIEKVYVPENEEELLQLISQNDKPFTVYGGGTGIVGGAVADGGIVISTSAFNKIKVDVNKKTVEAGSGVLLKDLNGELSKHNLWYPVDSTEQTATIGGNVATNAWGTRSFKYGSARNFVKGIGTVLPLKKRFSVNRGEIKANGDKFDFLLDGKRINFSITDLSEKMDMKNNCGYYMKNEMDITDLFIGAEGTLGIITGVKLKVLDLPWDVYAFMIPFKEKQNAVDFVGYVKQKEILSLEYMDHSSVDLLKQKYPVLHDAGCLVFFEMEAQKENEDKMFDDLYDVTKKFNIEEDSVIISRTKKKESIVYKIRESLPQTINEMIRQKKTQKISTDFAVNDKNFDKMMHIYDNILSDTKIKHFVYGHIGMNNLHINFIPENEMQRQDALTLYDAMAKEMTSIGGTVSAEHGIGKLKKKYLRYMYSDKTINKMKEIKKTFDPDNLCNRGDIFD